MKITGSKAALCAFVGYSLGTVAAARAAGVEFRDDFSTTTLGAGWGFVREDSAAHNLTERPGFLRIQTQRGAAADGVPINNLLLRSFSGDFILDTRVEFDPARAQEFAGLLVYQDDANFVSLGLVYASGPRGVFRGIALLGVADGAASTERPFAFYDADSTATPNVVYLRLLRSGDDFVAGYSADGVIYADIGTLNVPMSVDVRVGVTAANGDFAECGADCDVSIPADFDYLQISTYSGSDGGPTGGVTLDSLAIEGPDSVRGGESGQFTATAAYSDGSTVDVTAETSWTIAPAGLGSVDSGLFEAADLSAASQVTLVGAFTQLTSSGPTTRTDSVLVRIAVTTTDAPGPSACGAGMIAPFFAGLLILHLAAGNRHRRT